VNVRNAFEKVPGPSTGRRRALSALFALAAVAAVPSAARADGGPFGLGIILGEPTGITGKVWTGGRHAFDFGVAWSFDDTDAFHVYGDYLWHDFDLIDVSKGTMTLHFGPGARVAIRDRGDDRVGIRFVVGLDYRFETAPVDIFVDVVPVLDLAPDTDLEGMGGVGVRYYF
jgi:hypothetical protein